MEPINQFSKYAQKVRLTDGAKSRIRERLIAHLTAHPISDEPVRSPYQKFFGLRVFVISHRHLSIAVCALVLVVGVGGTTTFAATGVLPGDTLYPLKVGVIEPMKGFFARSPEAKAEFSVSLTETRLNEVEQLATNGALTYDEGRKSQKRFDRSLEAAQATIEKLSEDNPGAAVKIDDSFTELLDAHEAVLTNLGTAASSTDSADVQSFAKHVGDKVKVRKHDRGL